MRAVAAQAAAEVAEEAQPFPYDQTPMAAEVVEAAVVALASSYSGSSGTYQEVRVAFLAFLPSVAFPAYQAYLAFHPSVESPSQNLAYLVDLVAYQTAFRQEPFQMALVALDRLETCSASFDLVVEPFDLASWAYHPSFGSAAMTGQRPYSEDE